MMIDDKDGAIETLCSKASQACAVATGKEWSPSVGCRVPPEPSWKQNAVSVVNWSWTWTSDRRTSRQGWVCVSWASRSHI